MFRAPLLLIAVCFLLTGLAPLRASETVPSTCALIDADDIARKLGFLDRAGATADGADGCEVTFGATKDTSLKIGFTQYLSMNDIGLSFQAHGMKGFQSLQNLGDKAVMFSMDGNDVVFELRVLARDVEIDVSYSGVTAPAGPEKAKDELIAISRSLIIPALQSSDRFNAARRELLKCKIRGQSELCTLDIDLSGAPTPARTLTGEITESHGGNYMVKIDGGRTLAIKLAGPKGIVGMIECEGGQKFNMPLTEARIRIDKPGLCSVTVLIMADSFEAFGPFTMTIAADK